MAALPQLKDAALALDERVALLTFKRDDVRNALTSTDLTSDIVTTLAWANTSPDVSVLIITGDGNGGSCFQYDRHVEGCVWEHRDQLPGDDPLHE